VKGHNKNEISFPGNPGPVAGELQKSSPCDYDTVSLEREAQGIENLNKIERL
jgi:hypothetical protein